MLLTNSPIIVKAVLTRYTEITILRTATHTDFEGLRIQDSTTPTPDDVNELLSLIRYSDLYIRSRGSFVTNIMWQEMDPYHYDQFYLTNTFATPTTPRSPYDNSTIPSLDPDFSSDRMMSALYTIASVVPDTSSNIMERYTYVNFCVDGASDDAIMTDCYMRSLKISDRNMRQKIWSRIFNNK